VLAVIALLAVVVFFGSGAGNPLLSRLLVSRLERMTAAGWSCGAVNSLDGDAGKHNRASDPREEPAGTEPFFTAEEVQADLRIDSFWGRRISLNELIVQKPHVHIRVEKETAQQMCPPRHGQLPQANRCTTRYSNCASGDWCSQTGGFSTTTARHRSPCMGEICASAWMPGHDGPSFVSWQP